MEPQSDLKPCIKIFDPVAVLQLIEINPGEPQA
jgi:hypothetical protein